MPTSLHSPASDGGPSRAAACGAAIRLAACAAALALLASPGLRLAAEEEAPHEKAAAPEREAVPEGDRDAAAPAPDTSPEEVPPPFGQGIVPGPLGGGARPEAGGPAAVPGPGAPGDVESLEARELRAALEHTLKENAELRRLVEAAEAQRRVLVESLSEAVRVSEEQTLQARELRLKVEAFGVDLFAADESGLRERLLKAVRDLDIARQEESRRSAALQRLSESFLSYLAATTEAPEPQRAAAETAIREAGEALVDLAEAGEDAPTALSGSQVVSFDPEIGLVVFEAGRRAGLRVGTPVAVVRDERQLFSAMVVDVRDSIAGAVLQQRLAEGEEVSVGDLVELLPTDAEF